MNDDFIDYDFFAAQRLDAEKKKQKKLEKLERLKKRNNILQELHQTLENQKKTDFYINDLEIQLQKIKCFKPGSKEWALSFLNLPENINLKEIRKKYLKLAQCWHPDKNNDNSHEAMKYLNEAWQILKQQT